MKKLLSALLVSLFAFSCTSGPRDFEEIKEDGELRVVMSYNPLGFYRSEDTIAGVQHDMISEFCKQEGLNCKVTVQADLSTSINDLKDGKYDLIVKLIPVTTELKALVEFTHPLCLDKQVLVQRKTNKANQEIPYIKSQLELPGHCISMPKNSPYTARLKNLAQEIGDTIHIDEINNYQSEQLIVLVAKGDLDYTVCNYKLAKKVGAKYPQLDYSTAISFSQMQAWAVNKESERLLEKLNQWIDKNNDKYF